LRAAAQSTTPARTRCGGQPHFPLDFFLGGLLLPVVGLTAGTLGFIFLAITPPCHALWVSISSHHAQDLRCPATQIRVRLTDVAIQDCVRQEARLSLGSAYILPSQPHDGLATRPEQGRHHGEMVGAIVQARGG
jgi:hypothetical protein